MVHFSTAECTGGALLVEVTSNCFHCEGGSYSFNTSKTSCLKCEDNAVCVGTTVLVPKDGYWHSSPFSPFMQLCLVEEACKFENRIEILKAYYNESARIQQLLHDFNCSEWRWSEECDSSRNGESPRNKAEYKQCAEGYEGELCGSCSDGYGHTADGKCKKCSDNYGESLGIAVVLVIVAILSMGLKVYLGVNKVQTEVKYLCDEARLKRKTDLAIKLKMHEATRESTTSGEQQPVSSAFSNPPTKQRQESKPLADEGCSYVPRASSINPPGIDRSTSLNETRHARRDPTIESRKKVNAFGALADTFNVNDVVLSCAVLEFVMHRFCSITSNSTA